MAARSRRPWRTISGFKSQKHGHVTLWLSIYASPMSFGFSDAFAVRDCWRDEAGNWVHMNAGKPAELRREYVTHFAPADATPTQGPLGEELDWWRG